MAQYRPELVTTVTQDLATCYADACTDAELDLLTTEAATPVGQLLASHQSEVDVAMYQVVGRIINTAQARITRAIEETPSKAEQAQSAVAAP